MSLWLRSPFAGRAGVDLRRRARSVGRHRFDEAAWERRRCVAVARAFAEVPLYREQWARTGRMLAEPAPARAADLDGELYRLCPIVRPWEPTREPSLWIGDPARLRAALALAPVPPGRPVMPGRPVLEVREALVDWERLGRVGPPYAALLAPSATVRDPERRLELARPALALARRHGGAVLVGTRAERAAVLEQAVQVLGGARLDWVHVDRLTPAQVSVPDAAAPPERAVAVVHDPFLGYLAARRPDCGQVHVLWTDVHCRSGSEGLLVTLLRTRRPTLVCVVPVDGGPTLVERCPDHGTPTLTRERPEPQRTTLTRRAPD